MCDEFRFSLKQHLDKLNDYSIQLQLPDCDKSSLKEKINIEINTLKEIHHLYMDEQVSHSPAPSFLSTLFGQSLPKSNKLKIYVFIGTTLFAIISSMKNFKSLENSWWWNLSSVLCQMLLPLWSQFGPSDINKEKKMHKKKKSFHSL